MASLSDKHDPVSRDSELVSCHECQVFDFSDTFFKPLTKAEFCSKPTPDVGSPELDIEVLWPTSSVQSPQEQGAAAQPAAIEENIDESDKDIDKIFQTVTERALTNTTTTLSDQSLDDDKKDKLIELSTNLRNVRAQLEKNNKPALARIMEWSITSNVDKYLLLLSFLTATQQLFLEGNDEKALSLIISLTSSLTIFIRRANETPSLPDIEAGLRNEIIKLVLGQQNPLLRSTSESTPESTLTGVEMCSPLTLRQCSDPTNIASNHSEKIVQISLTDAKKCLIDGLDVTESYLETITVYVGDLRIDDPEEATIGGLLKCTIYTYRQVLENPAEGHVDVVLKENNPKSISIRKLGSLLGRLMHLCGRLSVGGGSLVVKVAVRIIRSIHNGLLYGGLYPYVITASVVYYARYEIAAGAYEVGRQGLFYILRTTVVENGLAWLQTIIREQMAAVATEVAAATATEVAAATATATAQAVVTQAARDQAQSRLTGAIAARVLEYVANPDNLLRIAQGVTGAARLALGQGGGGKKKRTKKRKRRRRGGSKKTKRRVKKSKKGGKRRRGGSKKRNRRSQRKTKK